MHAFSTYRSLVLALAGIAVAAGCKVHQTTSTAQSRAAQVSLRDDIAPPTLTTTVERFTVPGSKRAKLHRFSLTSDFPDAARFKRSHAVPSQVPTTAVTIQGGDEVTKDWTGIVLVPLDTLSSMAHTTDVKLEFLEAHPLVDGSVRVWTRVRNQRGCTIRTEVGCNFVTQERRVPVSAEFNTLEIAAGQYRDVFFVSPKENVDAYTVLVRGEGMVR